MVTIEGHPRSTTEPSAKWRISVEVRGNDARITIVIGGVGPKGASKLVADRWPNWKDLE